MRSREQSSPVALFSSLGSRAHGRCLGSQQRVRRGSTPRCAYLSIHRYSSVCYAVYTELTRSGTTIARILCSGGHGPAAYRSRRARERAPTPGRGAAGEAGEWGGRPRLRSQSYLRSRRKSSATCHASDDVSLTRHHPHHKHLGRSLSCACASQGLRSTPGSSRPTRARAQLLDVPPAHILLVLRSFRAACLLIG